MQLKNLVEALVKEYLQKEAKTSRSSARTKPRDDAPEPARSAEEPTPAADDGRLRDIVQGLMASFRID